MPSPRRGGAALLLLALGAAFTWGAVRLLDRRLTEGDVYPALSSLKADPDGAARAHEALRELRGTGVRRNFAPIHRLEAGPATTLLFLGLDPSGLDEADRREADLLDAAVRSGTRLVIALSPSRSRWPPPPTPTPKAETSEKKGASPRAGPRTAPGKRKDGSDDEAGISLWKRWGVWLEPGVPLDQPESARLASLEGADAPALPAGVPWHSGATFTMLDPSWRPIYTVRSAAVLIERTLGRGSIVLSTDATFAANTTLRFARQPALLAWLVGDRPEIVFDETHFGMGQREGIAALARRYRLEGLVLGLLALAALFVWKNAVPFAPMDGAPSGPIVAVAGRRASGGLASALRRHVAPAELSRLCIEEWKKTYARSRPAAALALSRGAESDPVAGYNRARTRTKEKGQP